jgi:phosphoenolpyruvate carboxylase
MNDKKIAELQNIHKRLAAYLKKQHEVTSNCILAVAAIREVLRQNPTLQKSYEENLRDLEGVLTIQQNQDHGQTLGVLLRELEPW